MDILQTALAVARTQIGEMESPLGSNRGPMVDQYHRAVGLNPAGRHPWCMAFMYWVFTQAAAQQQVKNPAIRSAGCLDVWRKANGLAGPKQVTAKRAQADWSLVTPGMIFILQTNANTGAGHTGMVESVDPKTGIMTTIEGNSNENGSPEGLGVFRLRRRKIGSINIGFIAYSEMEPLTPLPTVTAAAIV